MLGFEAWGWIQVVGPSGRYGRIIPRICLLHVDGIFFVHMCLFACLHPTFDCIKGAEHLAKSLHKACEHIAKTL